MAVYSYGASSAVNFSTFDAWSTAENDGNSNISLDNVMNNLQPADTAPHQCSELRGNNFLYGTVSKSGAAGTVAVTAGYTEAAAASFTLKNVNFDSVSSVTVTATAVYPRYLAGFYDADNGGGNLLVDYNEPTISGTITLTASTFTDKTAIYAHFIDAHA